MQPTENPRTSAPAQWGKEQEFFDDAARRAGDFDLPRIEARYRRALSAPLYPLECAYALLGDVRGKRILDVGCGHGEHSLLFAAWGGDVTGVDVSAGAIEVCKRRAAKLNLTGSTDFINAPFESLATGRMRFDVIWTCAFLHHVLDRLTHVLGLFDELLADDGRVIFMEPVRMSGWMKRARQLVPVVAAGTPDERPLEASDVEIVKRHYSFHDVSLFGPISRAVDRVGLSGNYENAPPFRRSLADAGYRLDRLLMRHQASMPAAMIMVSRLLRAPRG